MFKRMAAWLLCLTLLTVPPSLADAPHMGGGHAYIRSHTYTPAAQTRYTVNTLRHTAAGPEEEHILSFLPNSGFMPVLVGSDNVYHGGITLEEAAQKLRARGLDVVGGINGSYFNADMSPIGLQVRDGILMSMGSAWQPALGFNRDGVAIYGTPGYGISVIGQNGEVKVDRLNQSRQSGQVYMYSRDFSGTTRTTLDGMHVIIRADGRLIPGMSLYGTVTRVMTGKDPAPIGEGEYVLSANTADAIDRFRFLQEGDDILLSVTCADARWVGVLAAVGGLHSLVGEGQVLPVEETVRAPRTAAGITADGEVVFYTVDGRQSGYSAGLTLAELAARMAELNCVSAFDLDGGGSTVMSVRMPGETAAKVVNRPSDGSLRRCADFLLFCNVLPPADGQAAHLFPQPAYVTMLPGATADFTFLAADSAYRAVSPPAEPVTAAPIDGYYGFANGSSFTAMQPGEAIVAFTAGGAAGTAQVNITPVLHTVQIEQENILAGELTVAPGQTVQLNASGTLNGMPVLTAPSSFVWSAEWTVGTVTPNGLYTASPELGAKGRVTASAGGLTAEITVSVGGDPVVIEDFEDGVFSAGGEALSVSVTQDASVVERGRSAGAFAYRFEDSSPSVSVAMNAGINGSPKTLSALVTGDGSGHELLLELTLSDGQKSLVSFGALDFKGEKYLSAQIPPEARSVTGLTLYPNPEGPPSGTFYIHQILALWMDAMPDGVPSVQIGEPAELDGMFVYPLTVTDSAGRLPKNVSVRWDGEEVAYIPWDAQTGRAEIRVPLPADRMHILSVDAADILGRRSRAVVANDYGRPERSEAIWDVGGKWFTGYVDFLDEREVLNTDLVFGLRYYRPEKEITRLEAMVMIARILKLDLAAYAGTVLPFADLESLSEYEVSVIKAIYSEGIIAGKTVDGVLCVSPGGTMSHAEIFTILYNTLPQGYQKSDLSYFADSATVPAFALRATQTLVGIQVVRGSEGKLGFRSSMSRAEAASLFCRFFY